MLEDVSIIYVEATVDVDAASISNESEEQAPTKKGDYRQPCIQSFQAIEATIRAYTTYTLNAFKQMAIQCR